MGIFCASILSVCVLVHVGLFAPAQALDFCPRAENDCQSPEKMVVHKRVESTTDKLGVSDLLQDITQFNVSCKNLMGKRNSTHGKWKVKYYLRSLDYFVLFCRETPGRQSQRKLCSHRKELRILQIYSHPTERPVKAGSTFKGGVMTVAIIGICYDRRSIWNWMYSTGCAWGYPERGHGCSPDWWVLAVCQWWQSAARICSSGTQIRWSSGRVSPQSRAIKNVRTKTDEPWNE